MVIRPDASWRVLDIATATGHTALAFAPHVAAVVGLDLTPQMLPLAATLTAERGANNLAFLAGDVEDLPFGDGAFDLVTCRIAPHHFPEIGRFIAEAARVLRLGGVLAIVDNIVPGSRLRGKRADRQREAGAYINAFEKLRDPSHVRCLSFEEWVDALTAAGLAIEAQETLDKRLTFETWAAASPEALVDVVRAAFDVGTPVTPATFRRKKSPIAPPPTCAPSWTPPACARTWPPRIEPLHAAEIVAPV